MIRADVAAQKAYKFWLEATAPLTTMMNTGDIDQGDAIQGIRATLVLPGTASYHQDIQEEMQCFNISTVN